MPRYRLLAVPGFLLTLSSVVFGSSAPAPTPAFTITASNVTMSSNTTSASGSSSFTLTSVNGYTGQVSISCQPPAPPAGIKVPYCEYGNPGPIATSPITLTANEVVTGAVNFYWPVGCTNPCPVSLPRRGGHRLAPGLALAGALLFGFGIRRRAARWLTLTLLAMGALASLAGISSCGGNNSVLTPGTYAYMITATDTTTQVAHTASINVTVP